MNYQTQNKGLPTSLLMSYLLYGLSLASIILAGCIGGVILSSQAVSQDAILHSPSLWIFVGLAVTAAASFVGAAWMYVSSAKTGQKQLQSHIDMYVAAATQLHDQSVRLIDAKTVLLERSGQLIDATSKLKQAINRVQA